ncbi:MAG: hypothetical protein KDD73_15515 [Anaerolineales bacterium]|nr:hypothetical protein [Anaerolineales bacterium]MCB9172282.1 hypothetical protein [Ardenticatenales bacterium]
MDELIAHPDALEYVLRQGPDFLDDVIAHGLPVDQAARLISYYPKLDGLPDALRGKPEMLLAWGARNQEQFDEVTVLTDWVLKNHDALLGDGMAQVLNRAAKDERWDNKALEMRPLIEEDPARFYAFANADSVVRANSMNEARVALLLEKTGKLPVPFSPSLHRAEEFFDGNTKSEG